MAGAKFEYDEQGSTFYYFVISFYALVLIPASYYWWPKKTKKESAADSRQCHCEPCLAKDRRKKSKEPWKNFQHRLTKALLIFGWIGFVALSYKVANIEIEHQEYDPFAILGLDSGSTPGQIKRQFRRLSLEHHPDRGGDAKRFVKIAKAYEALTNEEVKANWEKYGNPDGQGVTRFGIALPSWIVDKDNSVWVLAVYLIAFMVILPTVVGVWWYKSIRYSAEQVLLDTTQLYFHFFHKTPNMILKRALMILGASFEYEKSHNKEIIERPSDDIEIPLLMKELPYLNEKNKERPLCYPYSLKARALLHAHLGRIFLNANTLEIDRQYVLQKCPSLVQEMITVIAQLIAFAKAGRTQRTPAIETLENVMKISPMLVQALWDNKSPLLQLPHFAEEIIRHCVTKKRRVTTCAELASMSEEDRNSLLRNLDPNQRHDILNVLGSMPRITMTHRVEVQDDEDKQTITAGALVTVFVHLKREPLMRTDAGGSASTSSHPSTSSMALEHGEEGGEDEYDMVPERLEEEEDENAPNGTLPGDDTAQQQPKKRVWEKNAKKKKGGKAPAAKNKKKAASAKGVAGKKGAVDPKGLKLAQAETNSTATDSPRTLREKSQNVSAEVSKNNSDAESDNTDGESVSDSDVDEAIKEKEAQDVDRDILEAEEDDMTFDDDIMKKERLLETKSKITHPVHCPYFPADKYEWWWVYITDKRRSGDKKRTNLITSPAYVTSLVDEEDIELKFAAPPIPGQYAFQLCLRSDSYLDCDQVKDFKIQVHPAREITSHPQWDFPSEDDEKVGSDGSASEGSDYTEEEVDEDD